MVKREGRAAAASEGAECHRKTAPAFFSSADEKRSSPALADGPDIKFRPVTGQNRPVYDRFLYRPVSIKFKIAIKRWLNTQLGPVRLLPSRWGLEEINKISPQIPFNLLKFLQGFV